MADRDRPAAYTTLRFSELREANVSRLVRWHGDADEWSGADWSNAMCGEAGEAANVIKKLRRHETGTGTSYNKPPIDELLLALAEELADVVTYADLLAHKYGIDLGLAVAEKFNKVSAAQDFPERLPVSRRFGVSLADKPTDILVHLAEHGPARTHEIADALNIRSGLGSALGLLRELGLIEGPRNEHEQRYRATEEGARLVAEARAAEEVRNVG